MSRCAFVCSGTTADAECCALLLARVGHHRQPDGGGSTGMFES